MPTSAALMIAALLAAPPTLEDRSGKTTVLLELGAEATLVGLTFGLRPELLLQPGGPGTVSQIRFALGVFRGPDQTFIPASVGYRAHFRSTQTFQPLVGAGLEMQSRLVNDLPPVNQYGLYLEGGLAVGLSPSTFLGVMFSADLMFFGGPGFGFGPRLFFGFRS
jgi:hypothetical protein